jgi:hypothetical protein
VSLGQVFALAIGANDLFTGLCGAEALAEKVHVYATLRYHSASVSIRH